MVTGEPGGGRFLAGETAGEPSDEIRRPGSAERLMGLFRSKRPSWAARARVGPCAEAIRRAEMGRAR